MGDLTQTNHGAAIPLPSLDLSTSWSVHHTSTKPGRFSGWKFRRSNYGVFVDGTVKPYRVYVIDHRDNRMREVTKLLPRLR